MLCSHSVMSDFAAPWTAAHQASLSFTISWSLLKHMSIELVMPSPSHPLSSPSPPALNLFHHQGLSKESALRIRWPKYRSFSFSISLSNEYSGLISFKIDWFDLLLMSAKATWFMAHGEVAQLCAILRSHGL